MNRDAEQPDAAMPIDLSDDAQLVVALRIALDEVDPYPLRLHEYATSVFLLGGLDAELATLAFDSLAGAGPATRAGTDAQVLVYSGAMLSIELEFAGDTVLGQLTALGPAKVTVQTRSTSTTVDVDENGSFRFAHPSTDLRVVVERDGDVLVTPWWEAP